MMGDVTLTEFLLARIVENEREAQAVIAEYEECPPSVYDMAQVPYFAAGEPHRVVAECEAKRRSIRRAQAAEDALHDDIDDQTYFIRRACHDTWQLALQDMALPYADQPDYREEWRV